MAAITIAGKGDVHLGLGSSGGDACSTLWGSGAGAGAPGIAKVAGARGLGACLATLGFAARGSEAPAPLPATRSGRFGGAGRALLSSSLNPLPAANPAVATTPSFAAWSIQLPAGAMDAAPPAAAPAPAPTMVRGAWQLALVWSCRDPNPNRDGVVVGTPPERTCRAIAPAPRMNAALAAMGRSPIT